MKSKAVNQVAFATAVIGFLLFVLLIWQWYGQSQYGPPAGSRTDISAPGIGDIIFMGIFFPKIGLTILAMIAVFTASTISTIAALFFVGPKQCKAAWIPLCISINTCALIWLTHNLQTFFQWQHFAALLLLSIIGFGLSITGALGVMIAAKSNRAEHLFQLFALNGFVLGMISLIAFVISNWTLK